MFSLHGQKAFLSLTRVAAHGNCKIKLVAFTEHLVQCLDGFRETPFFNIHRSGVLTALAWLVPHEIAAVSAQVLCTPYNHAPCHFMQSHIRKMYACLAVTCHLHFWQNDRDLLRAAAVIRGWNGYRNQSQHRRSTLEKKILPPLQQGRTRDLSITSPAL